MSKARTKVLPQIGDCTVRMSSEHRADFGSE